MLTHGAAVRGLLPQKRLVAFSCSMRRLIDPGRLYKLTTEQSKSVNEIARVCVLQSIAGRWKKACDKNLYYERVKYCGALASYKMRNNSMATSFILQEI